MRNGEDIKHIIRSARLSTPISMCGEPLADAIGAVPCAIAIGVAIGVGAGVGLHSGPVVANADTTAHQIQMMQHTVPLLKNDAAINQGNKYLVC